MHRAQTVQGLHELVTSLGLNLRTVLRQVGLPQDAYDDPDNLLDFSATCRLLNALAATSGCEQVGLRLGSNGGLVCFGDVGTFVSTSATVGDALELLADHLNLMSGVSMLWLNRSAGQVTLVYALHEPAGVSTRQYYDAGMAIACMLLRELCGPRWRANEVRFAHRRPVALQPYRKFYRAPLHYDAADYALVFDETWLRRPLATADQYLHARLQRQVARLKDELVQDVSLAVRQLIRKLLPLGLCSIEQVAAILKVHRRTLDRQLDRLGTSFSELKEAVRKQIAYELLEETDLPLSVVASALSYSSAANFCTSFRRWSGRTPGGVRARSR